MGVEMEIRLRRWIGSHYARGSNICELFYSTNSMRIPNKLFYCTKNSDDANRARSVACAHNTRKASRKVHWLFTIIYTSRGVGTRGGGPCGGKNFLRSTVLREKMPVVIIGRGPVGPRSLLSREYYRHFRLLLAPCLWLSFWQALFLTLEKGDKLLSKVCKWYWLVVSCTTARWLPDFCNQSVAL